MALEKDAIRGIGWRCNDKIKIPKKVELDDELKNLSCPYFPTVDMSLEMSIVEDAKLVTKKTENNLLRKNIKENVFKNTNDLNINLNVSQNNTKKHHSNTGIGLEILKPTIIPINDDEHKQSRIQTCRSESIDFKEFESEQDPFDNVELKTLDDMAELDKVYSKMQLKIKNESKPIVGSSIKHIEFPHFDENKTRLTNNTTNNINMDDHYLYSKAIPAPNGLIHNNHSLNNFKNSKSNPDLYNDTNIQNHNQVIQNVSKTPPLISPNKLDWNHYMPLPPTSSYSTTSIENEYVINNDKKELSAHMIAMGFNSSCVFRTINKLTNYSEEDIINYLCSVSSIKEEIPVDFEQIEKALDNNNFSETQAKMHLKSQMKL